MAGGADSIPAHDLRLNAPPLVRDDKLGAARKNRMDNAQDGRFDRKTASRVAACPAVDPDDRLLHGRGTLHRLDRLLGPASRVSVRQPVHGQPRDQGNRCKSRLPAKQCRAQVGSSGCSTSLNASRINPSNSAGSLPSALANWRR